MTQIATGDGVVLRCGKRAVVGRCFAILDGTKLFEVGPAFVRADGTAPGCDKFDVVKITSQAGKLD